ncbi:integumentary mucin C.1-like [Dendronephthya gigantea]|uniref:integumentary mucin C.1-like n=1 Tax=Dendronephthya gigantea TaxID=151771 RepID=UPI00106D57C7|nr:integumentary mucin C.1-like [Dendronephthya gigantea]
MSGHKRQWVLVVLVCLGLLTLYTANGHPYLERNAETGIRDDPAELMLLSLVEREAKNEDISGGQQSGSSENVATTNSLQSNTISASLMKQQTPSLSTLNRNVATVASDKTSISKAALTQNVRIIATTNVATGITIGLTSTRTTSVNMNKTNSSRTLQNAPNKSSIILATYAKELKPSSIQHPTGSLSLSVVNGASSFNSALTSSPRTTVLATKPAPSSVAVNLNLSGSTNSAAIRQQIITSSLYLNVIPTSSAGLQNVPSSNVIFNSMVVQSSPLVRSSIAASEKASMSITTPKLGASRTSSQSLTESTAIQKPSETSSTKAISKGLSTIALEVPSTQVSSSANTKPPSQTSEKLPSTNQQTTPPSTTPQGSSSPPTKGITVPESTSTVRSSDKPTTKLTTKNPTTVESKKPSTKATSSASSTSETSTTVTKQPTTKMKPKTTKEVKTKATSKATTTASDMSTTVPKKPTTNPKPETTNEPIMPKTTAAEKAQTIKQNNDEGRMPPPDQGKEAVLWDFIIPVAIGTGVALVIAFGVIVVRACRRRRLIKVRFGGKPSHPRLLNNDLINLLAESDDEEEE